MRQLTAKLDRRGSEGAKSAHYTFGLKGDHIGGGLYIPKDQETPDSLLILFKKGEEDEQS